MYFSSLKDKPLKAFFQYARDSEEYAEKLREEAVKYFNETLDLMQKGTNEEAFKTYALLL